MEIVYAHKIDNNIFPKDKITGIYGDVLNLINYGENVEGVIYDDTWTVKRFLNGHSLRINKRIFDIFKYIDFAGDILKKKISELSKTDFKYILLTYILIKNENIIILDHFDVGLNYNEQKKLIRIIRALKKDGRHIIVISNNLVFMSQVVEKIVIFKKNSIYFSGTIGELLKADDINIYEPVIIKFIKLANKKGARLDLTLDSKELLKDIYRSVF